MTVTAGPRHAYVPVIDIEDTVTLHLPEDLDTRDLSNYRPGPTGFRRPPLDDTAEQPAYEVPRTIGIVYDLEDVRQQQRFNDFYRAKLPAGRHRAARPGLFARLLRWIGERR